MDQSTKATLMRLIQKAPEEEASIDEYLKKQIESALKVYSAANFKQKHKFLQGDNDILIKEAEKKLQTISTEITIFQPTNKTVKEIKKYLLGLETVIKKAKPEECEEVMTRAINYAKQVDRLNQLQPKDRQHIQILLLKLFVRVPPIKVSKLFQETLPKLNDAYSTLNRCDIKKVHSSNMQNLKTILSEVLEAVDKVKRISTKLLNKIEEKVSGGNPDQILDKLSIEIGKYDAQVSKLSPPVLEDTIKTIKEKLSILKNRLDKVSAKSNSTQNKKKQLEQKIVVISESLAQMNRDFSILRHAETKISKIAEATEDFVKKKIRLESELKLVKRIHTGNRAIRMKKNQVENGISGIILVEGMNYLRDQLEVVEDFKSYAQKFAYPRRIKMFNVKKKEISSVLNNLDCLPEDNLLFKTRINVINDRVKEALIVLEKKADENEKIIHKLEELKRIAQEISDLEKNPELSLYVFNEFRSRIQAIEDFSFRTIAKKKEILQQLHQFEIGIYKKHFPKIASGVEEHLHTYELLTQQLNSLNKTEKYLTSQVITNGRTAMRMLIKSKIDLQNVEGFQQLFGVFFDQIQQLWEKRHNLDRLVAEMDTINNDLKELSRTNVSTTEKNRSLNALEGRVKLLKVDTARIDLLKKLLQLQVNIKIERAKIEIDEILNSRISKLTATMKTLNPSDISSDEFTRFIEEVLILKERVQDLPDGSANLNSQKELVSQELCSFLDKFHQTLARNALKKRKSENVLDVENYFSKLDFDNIPNKENVQFVRKICAHAKTFEDKIECYFGSRDSVDYYIIHENLVRCLDELDQLKCDDDGLLDETITAMTYVKGLKARLLNNAYRSD